MLSPDNIHLISQENMIAYHDEEMFRLLDFLEVEKMNLKQLKWHRGDRHYDKNSIEFPDEARDILIQRYSFIVKTISENYPIDASLWKNFN